MNIKQLRAFLAVARDLSFAQASERLHLSQSALSLTIKALEEQLGGRLFIRTTRSVALTPEGEVLLPLARRLMADWSQTESALLDHFALKRGLVSLAAMPSFAANRLPPVVKRFRSEYPGIKVRVHDVINEDVVDRVRERRVEMGIAFRPPADPAIEFIPLYMDRFHAVLPADSPFTGSRELEWPTLLGMPFIALQEPSTVRLMMEERLASENLSLSVEIETHQLTTVGRMVACGLGVSAVPQLCVGQMHELGARCVPLSHPVLEQEVGLLVRPDAELSAAAAAFRDLLQASGAIDGLRDQART